MKAAKILLSVLLVAALLFSALSLTVFAQDVDTTAASDADIALQEEVLAESGAEDDLAESGVSYITNIYINNVIFPFSGEYPSYTFSIPAADQNRYKAYDHDTAYLKNGIFWYNVTDESSIAVNSETFETGKQYMVRVLVTPYDSSYAFSVNLKAEINGKNANIIDYGDGLIGVEYTFTCGPVNGTTGDCVWSFNGKTNTLTISGSGNMADYSPSNVPWVNYLDYVKKVNIGSGVKYIGQAAFSRTALVSVTIPDSVTQIGTGAFWRCGSLSYVKLGNNLKTIGEMAFRETALTSVTIPNNVETVSKEAFEDCNALSSVQFGTKVKTVGDFAFQRTALTSVIIPDSVQSIGYRAFYNCRSQNGNGPLSLVYLELGSGLKTIGKEAFCNAALTEVTIPASVTYIGDKAFGYNYNENTSTYSKASGFTIKGMKGSAAETYAKENGFTFISLGGAYSVSGTFTSYLAATDAVTFQLLQDNTVKYSTTKTGNTGTFSITNVAEGTYTLRVMKKNHTTRDYAVSVRSDTEISVTINPIGDVTLNGVVDIKDVNALYKHVMESKKLTDPYAIKCGDVANDVGSVDIKDVNALYQHVMETKPLY